MTGIPYVSETCNPITGCTRVSPGCDNCYARRMAQRLCGRFGYPQGDPFRVTLHPERLEEPLHWAKPRMIFVCSMGDLFHPRVPWDFIFKVFNVMEQCPQHIFQVLTKRPGRMAHYAKGRIYPWPSTVWAGVSISEARQLPWLDVLRRVPAPVRFVSLEPCLGDVDLRPWLCWTGNAGDQFYSELDAPAVPPVLDWVILGPETGPKARLMELDWARRVRDDCAAAGVPFFFKRGLLDGVEHRGMPG